MGARSDFSGTGSVLHVCLIRHIFPSMTHLGEIVNRLASMSQKERRELGETVGMPFDTVQKIALRKVKNPRLETYLKLAEAIERQAA